MKKEALKKKLPDHSGMKGVLQSASKKKASAKLPKVEATKEADRRKLKIPSVRKTAAAKSEPTRSAFKPPAGVVEPDSKHKPGTNGQAPKEAPPAAEDRLASAMGAKDHRLAPEIPSPAVKNLKNISAQTPETGAKAVKPIKSAKKSGQDSSEKALVKFDPLQRYLSEISKYKLLTREQERELGLRVKEQGDTDAAYALVTANLRLVVKIALEFQRVWMQNLLDLIQEGNIGLMQAVKKFDPYKNVKFSYYASFWIKAYILKFIMDNWRLVKIGTTQGQRKLFFKLKKEKQRLVEQGFDPKPKLLSERLGVSEREIVDMDQRLDGWDVSLDAPLKNDSETERIEFISTESESVEDQVSKKEIELLLHNKISEFRKKMSSREIEIFELRIFSDNPLTLQEIGDRYGISRERVRQIEKNIIRKMREFFKHEIPDFASYAEDEDAQ